MERKLLEYEGSVSQVTPKSVLERFNLFHSFDKFFTRFSCNLLRHFIRLDDFITNFVDGNLHTFCKQCPFILSQILRFDLSFFNVVSIIFQVSIDQSMQLSFFNVVSAFDFLRFAFVNLMEKEIFRRQNFIYPLFKEFCSDVILLWF